MKKKRKIWNIWLKASYTVESAFIMPMILAVIVLTLGTGINLHNQVCRDADDIAKVQEIDAVKLFRGVNGVKQILTEVVGED